VPLITPADLSPLNLDRLYAWQFLDMLSPALGDPPMTLRFLEFAAKHPALSASVAGTLAKNPAVLGPLVQAATTGSWEPLATTAAANTDVVATILQQVFAYIAENPQVIGDILSLILEFVPK
jgi:hypothetical protein